MKRFVAAASPSGGGGTPWLFRNLRRGFWIPPKKEKKPVEPPPDPPAPPQRPIFVGGVRLRRMEQKVPGKAATKKCLEHINGTIRLDADKPDPGWGYWIFRKVIPGQEVYPYPNGEEGKAIFWRNLGREIYKKIKATEIKHQGKKTWILYICGISSSRPLPRPRLQSRLGAATAKLANRRLGKYRYAIAKFLLLSDEQRYKPLKKHYRREQWRLGWNPVAMRDKRGVVITVAVQLHATRTRSRPKVVETPAAHK